MKIRVLFYRAERDGHWLDDGISLWTKLWNWKTKPYSHVEVYWTSAVGMEWCFTSTMRGDVSGTVMRLASEVLTHPERWDVCEIQVDDDKAENAISRSIVEVNTNLGYDFGCIMGFFLPWRIRGKNKNICSEAVQKFLVWCDVFPDEQVWSPRRLSAKLLEKGYTIKPFKEREA